MKISEIESGLKQAGLGKGDIVLLHSSLSALGEVQGGVDGLVGAFLAVLGEAGTLVTPTFAGGAVPDAVARHPRAITSIAPTAVMSAIGAAAEDICKDHWKAEAAHARGTPCMRVAERGGYVCLLGVDQDRSTLLHGVEELLQLPYLKTTKPREIETPEGMVTASFKFFPGPHRDFIGLDRVLRQSGVVTIHRVGNAVMRLMKADAVMAACLELGRTDAAFVLCDNPHCADCTRQRASIRRHRLAKEDFRLVAAGSLAGRYVPEMMEACSAAGVDCIELDAVQGKPVQAIPADTLAAQIEELKAQGLTVTGLRASAAGEGLDGLFETAVETGLARVVLPLTRLTDEQVASAAEKDLTLSFYNVAVTGAAAGDQLAALRDRGVDPGFTFNCANFARAGQNPFLGSYKGNARRMLDQLDVEDCTYAGVPQPLANGNAEVKEMISALRCTSFSGNMVLGAGNRQVATLRDTAKRFVELLERM